MIACISAQPALGQDQATSSEQLESADIVVTAQKREERTTDVPLSITAISGETLERRNIANIADLSYAVPGLSVLEYGAGRQELVIRGIQGSRGGSSLTGVYLDEIPLTGAQDGYIGNNLDARTIDLKRVEVLKGPQGTLFGEGAAGGVIRLITNEPDLNDVGGEVKATLFGTRDGSASYQALGIINVPLVDDRLALRVAATYEHGGGWIDQPSIGRKNINDNDLKHVRAKLRFSPSAAVDLIATAIIHRNKGGGSPIANVEPFRTGTFEQAIDPNIRTDFTDEYDAYNLTGIFDLDFATLTSSTSYFRGEGVSSFTQNRPGSQLTLVVPDYVTKPKTFSQEIRLASNGDTPLKWVVGAQYKNSRIDASFGSGFEIYIRDNLGVEVVLNNINANNVRVQKSDAWAGFADASYTFFDRLEVGGGLRYFSDTRRASQLPNFGAPPRPETVQKADFDKLTWRAFVRFEAADDINLYANVANGFRSGGFNDATFVAQGAPPSFGPETALFYEVGLKSLLLDRRLSFEAAAYTGKFTDQLQDVTFVNPAGNIIQYTLNAGVSRIRGAEVSMSLQASNRLRLGFNAEVIDTKYTRVTALSPFIVGDPMNLVPDHSISASATYRVDWSSEIAGALDLSFNRQGRKVYTTRNDSFATSPNVTSPLNFLQASASAEWQGFTLTVFGRNLLNERKAVTPHPYGARVQARPMSLGFSVSKQF
jgi:outer membrane receptor protein involved in Fe transport